MLTKTLHYLSALGLGVLILSCVTIVTDAGIATAAQVCKDEVDRWGQVAVVCWEDQSPQDPGGSGSGSEGDSKECKTSNGTVLECSNENGIWNGTCYVKLIDPQPEKSDPWWEGHSDGYIVNCSTPLFNGTLRTFITWPKWVASLPGQGPSPRELADRAVAAMKLTAGEPGTTPPAGVGSIGIIGLPTWLWIANPAENTTGPITRTETGGAITVAATAHLDRMVWTMGDGGSATCSGAAAPGTPYSPSQGSAPSPTCGYTYTKTSAGQRNDKFVVTATAHWVVTWAGGGQSGTIVVPPQSSTTQLMIGELQVLNTR